MTILHKSYFAIICKSLFSNKEWIMGYSKLFFRHSQGIGKIRGKNADQTVSVPKGRTMNKLEACSTLG